VQYPPIPSAQFFCIIITTMETVKGRNTTFTGFAKCSRLCTWI